MAYILGIDASGGYAHVALVNDGVTVCSLSSHEEFAAEVLLLLIDKVLSQAQVTLQDVSLLAVALGPGSFTGIRSGLATTLGLSSGQQKQVVGVPVLLGRAFGKFDSADILVPFMTANEKNTGFQKGESYFSLLQVFQSSPVELINQEEVKIGESDTTCPVYHFENFNVAELVSVEVSKTEQLKVWAKEILAERYGFEILDNHSLASDDSSGYISKDGEIFRLKIFCVDLPFLGDDNPAMFLARAAYSSKFKNFSSLSLRETRTVENAMLAPWQLIPRYGRNISAKTLVERGFVPR